MPLKKSNDDFENEEGDYPDWDSQEEMDNEGERIDFYRRVCVGDDECNEEELKAWANERFKHKQAQAKPAALPCLSSMKMDPKTSDENHSIEETKLSLPKGGWKVQQVHLSDESKDLPTLMSSKLDLKPKKKINGPRENVWKKMPNFFSDVNEASSLPSAECFEKKEESFTQKESVEKEDEFRPAPSRSRERTERKPRLLPPSKREDKPQVLKNTKMCKNGEQCNRRASCTFAHTLEEFNPIPCRFQKNCNQKLTCSFKHEFESKEEYISRIKIL